MNVSNPSIIDASLRDVALCLSDNQKVDLLLYAMKTLNYDGCVLFVFFPDLWHEEHKALTRSLLSRADALESYSRTPSSPVFQYQPFHLKTRREYGYCVRGLDSAPVPFSARKKVSWTPPSSLRTSLTRMRADLQAALIADPDNPEAQALLHQRSVNVEKLLAPQPLIIPRSRFSPEIWREIALFLPRRDLKTLLHVPNPVSNIAGQLLFRQLDLHFSGLSPEYPDEDSEWAGRDLDRDRHAQRSADILARIITDNSFASVIRTLRVFSFKLDGDAGFHIGILANALPKLINIRNVHITASVEGALSIIRILEFTRPRIHGLSLQILDGALDLSGFNFTHLGHFSYDTNFSTPANSTPTSTAVPIAPQSTTLFISQNNVSLRKLSLQTPSSGFPSTESLALRNLTHLSFTGCIPASSTSLLPDVLTHGRQIDSLSLNITVDCLLSQHFRAMSSGLPFLRHFAFSIRGGVSRRLNDRDLFPSIAEFLRGRKELRSLTLCAPSPPSSHSNNNAEIQRSTGFDSGVWGVLPTLTELTTLTISWPKDLAPGLGGWLIPRNVKALVFDGIGANMIAERDPVAFFNQLRPGVPASLVYVGFMDSPLRSPAQIIEQGFPMVKLLRLESTYWTVKSNLGGGQKEARSPTVKQSNSTTSSPPTTTSNLSPVTSTTNRPILPSRTLSHSHTPGYSHTSTTYHPSPLSSTLAAQPAPAGARPILPSLTRSNSENRVPQVQVQLPMTSRSNISSVSSSTSIELEKWPRRRVAFHLSEWMEWLGCAEVVGYDRGEFGF
ncbi:hypothetical protein V5O48_004313 [Marasmius crinis-equi]|uniref:Uncharacterized protein n=1 Tax=Marasmius crinis-equi TaxID=585013 RepID=A0ABR3FQM8_9AGAR